MVDWRFTCLNELVYDLISKRGTTPSVNRRLSPTTRLILWWFSLSNPTSMPPPSLLVDIKRLNSHNDFAKLFMLHWFTIFWKTLCILFIVLQRNGFLYQKIQSMFPTWNSKALWKCHFLKTQLPQLQVERANMYDMWALRGHSSYSGNL